MPSPVHRGDGNKIRVSPRMALGIAIGVLALIYIIQNSERTHVHLLFWKVDWPVWLLLLIVFVAGVIVGSLFPWFRRRSQGGRRSPDS